MSKNITINDDKKFYFEEAILILLLILALVGVGITDFSPSDGFLYWLIMAPVFAVSALLIGWLQSRFNPQNFRRILRAQALHWLAVLMTIIGAFMVEKSGRIQPQDAGLVILLMLSLAIMLDGMRVGWRFSLVGLFLGVSAVIAAYTVHFWWIGLLIALLLVAITILWQIWQTKRGQ